MKTPATLLILDGYGLTGETKGSAVAAASTPVLDRIFAQSACCQLSASGLDVGLPEGQMGNSEVGHTNMGAGRVVFQDLPRITRAVQDGTFFQNPAYLDAMKAARAGGKALHIFGLLSDGGVHSHMDHILAILKMAKEQDLSQVWVHAFLDGRDTPPQSGRGYMEALADQIAELGVGRVGTVSGRYYAMDRDNRWERVQKAWDAIADAKGFPAQDPVQAVQDSYERFGVTDEFVVPVVIGDYPGVAEGDSIIFMNFRPDRARELTRCFVDPDFTGLPRTFRKVNYVCTTEYDAAMPNVTVAFPHQELRNVFGEYLSALGLKQLRIAETEKYAHVTFFFNGGREEPFAGEDRCLIPSPKVATYDLKPEMSAFEVAEEAEKRIRSGAYDVIVLNFANCDMVGHTGNFDAAVKAVEAVDACVGRVAAATADMGGFTLVTADHGNAEQMLLPDGSPCTAHTTNPVPFAIVGAQLKLRPGRLCDIVPTMLDLMGLSQPEEMDGQSLIVN